MIVRMSLFVAATALVSAAPYLTPETTIDAAALIGPPPAIGSPRELADRARFDETRARTDTIDWVRARSEDMLSKPEIALHAFSCAAGVALSPATTPKALALFDRLLADARLTYRASKDRFQRVRPFVGNDKPICVSRDNYLKPDPSYPSGHAEVGYAWALLLAEALPERASPIVVAGRQFGDDRVLCGVHFQSDIDAGRLIGAALVARLHADPAFQRDEAEVIVELRGARGKAVPRGCAD